MAGASGNMAWTRCGVIRAGVFALASGIGFHCAHGGAFACLGALLVEASGFWAAEAWWLLWEAVATADGGGVLHIFVSLCGHCSAA